MIQKHPQIAQQFWVYACYELPQRNTRQRNPEPSFNIYVDKRKKQKYPQIAKQFWVCAFYELPPKEYASA